MKKRGDSRLTEMEIEEGNIAEREREVLKNERGREKGVQVSNVRRDCL